MKLSYPMYRVLRQISRGEPVNHHCRNRSDYGGLVRTIYALRKRGLIEIENEHWKLTAAGKAALEKYEE